MGMWINLPFALFCLVDLPQETINKTLKKAFDGPDAWVLWLASRDYEDAPQKHSDQPHEGTIPPIDESFTSDFNGKKVEDVADWLKNKPDSVSLETHHFAILDKRTETDGTIVICKIGDEDLKGTKLDYLRFDAAEAALHLGGMEYGTWEGFNPDGKRTAKIEY